MQWYLRLLAIFTLWVGILVLLGVKGMFMRDDGVAILPHGEQVWSIAFSGDGKMLASGSVEGTVKIWDSASLKLKWTLQGINSTVRSIAFPQQIPCNQLAAGGEMGRIIVWRIPSPTSSSPPEIQRTMKTKVTGVGGGVSSLIFVRGNRHLVVGGESVGVVDTWTGKYEWTLDEGRPHSVVGPISMTSDEKVFAFTWNMYKRQDEPEMRLWDSRTGHLISILRGVGYAGSYDSTAFSPDGRYLACGWEEGVDVWDVRKRTLRKKLGLPLLTTSEAVAFSHDGSLLAAAVTVGPFLTGVYARRVFLWDMRTLRRIRTIRFHSYYDYKHLQLHDWITSLAFSPVGDTLAAGCIEQDANGVFTGSVKVIRIK